MFRVDVKKVKVYTYMYNKQQFVRTHAHVEIQDAFSGFV